MLKEDIKPLRFYPFVYLLVSIFSPSTGELSLVIMVEGLTLNSLEIGCNRHSIGVALLCLVIRVQDLMINSSECSSHRC